MWLVVLSVCAGVAAGGDRLRRQADRRRRGAAGTAIRARGPDAAGARATWCWSSSGWWCCWPPSSAAWRCASRCCARCSGQRVNEMILEKALTLSLSRLRGLRVLRPHDARAARGLVAPAEPGQARASASCRTPSRSRVYGALLVHFSRLGRAGARAGGGARVRGRERASPTTRFACSAGARPRARMQNYLETLLAREDHAKEVTLFRLGPLFLARYREIFAKLFARGPRAHAAARRVGLRARPAEHAGLLRRLRVDRDAARSAGTSRSAT